MTRKRLVRAGDRLLHAGLPGRTYRGHVATDEEGVRRRLLASREAATARRDDLLGDLRSVVAGSRDVATDDEHDPEGATIAYERSKVMALVRQAEDQLADIRRALARLDAGAYATCDRCGRGIGDARLTARPSATTCVNCAAPTQ